MSPVSGRTTPACEIVSRKAWDPAWQELIVRLADMVDCPLDLLHALADEREDDLFRHRLALAARCLGEISGKSRGLPEMLRLRDEITSDVFNIVWRRHLDRTEAVVSHLTPTLSALVLASGEVEGVPLIERLARLTHSQVPVERGASLQLIEELGELGGRYRSAVDALIDVLLRSEGVYDSRKSGGYPGHHVAAMSALEAMGERASSHTGLLDDLLTVLLDSDWERRSGAAKALGAMGAAAAAHPGVVDSLLDLFLHDDSRAVRYACVHALCAQGPPAAEHPGVLVTLSESVRNGDGYAFASATALAAMDERATSHLGVVDAVVACLIGDDSLGSWWPAWDASKAIREGALARYPGLIAALIARFVSYRDWGALRAAGEALGGLQHCASYPHVIDLVLAGLMHGDSMERSHAAHVLMDIGEAAAIAQPSVIEDLLALLDDADPQLRHHAAHAVGVMGETAARTPDLLGALVKQLSDSDCNVRDAACRSLRRLGPASYRYPGVVEGLLERFDEKDTWCCWAAAEAVGALDEETRRRHPEVLDSLVENLRRDPPLRRAAMEALGIVGESVVGHPQVVQTLLAGLQVEDDMAVAARALSRLQAAGVRFFVHTAPAFELASTDASTKAR